MKNVHKSLAPQFKHNLESSVLSLLPTFFDWLSLANCMLNMYECGWSSCSNSLGFWVIGFTWTFTDIII